MLSNANTTNVVVSLWNKSIQSRTRLFSCLNQPAKH